MKKFLVILGALALVVPQALAATIYMQGTVDLDLNETKLIPNLEIVAEYDGEINAQYGINILLAPEVEILWDDRMLSLSGSAVANGRVVGPASFSDDYKVLHIPVAEDFLTGEMLVLGNVAMRSYDQDFGNRWLKLDLNGDLIGDFQDINNYEVQNVDRSDNTKPYPIRDLSYTLGAEGTLTLNWVNPPDYDLRGAFIAKSIPGGAFIKTFNLDWSPETFVDDVTGLDAVQYDVDVFDTSGNHSEPVTLVIDLTQPQEPAPTDPTPTEPTPTEPTPTEPAAPADEVAELTRLLNYYNVRYSIKCMPSGVAVAENDSACLWARIDLIYSQEITGEVLVEGVALTARDLELMAVRRKWPELRYQENCVEASEPEDYCPALGKALDRISYFLD
ncbi:MAG: hypothetical protein OEY44_01100 [Candidatus Peregrinibacteria bacterium]|nr:hypothetical protein [Candidatus Peregrinibacteria bacterium]